MGEISDETDEASGSLSDESNLSRDFPRFLSLGREGRSFHISADIAARFSN